MAPFLRASDNPIAIACFGFVTFLPLRPDLSFPCFIVFISRSTELEAFGLYFLPLDFLELVFFAELFFALFFELVFLDGMLLSSSHSEATASSKVVSV
ncbi:MAG TPA: hypothetical protein VL967_06135 [Terracidiphilus sp.]|nr:hypothetical protein [Terracidiphilus sp.]